MTDSVRWTARRKAEVLAELAKAETVEEARAIMARVGLDEAELLEWRDRMAAAGESGLRAYNVRPVGDRLPYPLHPKESK